jgi:hypothetical protein
MSHCYFEQTCQGFFPRGNVVRRLLIHQIIKSTLILNVKGIHRVFITRYFMSKSIGKSVQPGPFYTGHRVGTSQAGPKLMNRPTKLI